MYVSSFSTYINTDSPRKTHGSSPKKSENETGSFEAKLLAKSANATENSLNLPINYISNYKTLSNQQKLQQDTKSYDEAEFTKIQTLNSAKDAYSDNSEIFSLLLKPKVALNQTPKIDQDLSKEIQDIKKDNLRNTMLNTYISNENYYRVTA